MCIYIYIYFFLTLECWVLTLRFTSWLGMSWQRIPLMFMCIISHRPPGGFTERLLDFQPFMQVKLHFLHLDTSWVLTLKNQEKCSILYIYKFPPAPRRVYRETSWFSAIYAGKIAFFTFGRFVGSNFEKPRTRQESVLCTKCSISYIISHRPVRGVYRETSSFSVIYAGTIVFFTFGNFVGSRVKSPFYVRNAAFRT